MIGLARSAGIIPLILSAAEQEKFESFLARDKNVSQGGMMKAIGQGFR